MVSRTECNAAGAHQNAVNASLLLNLINNNFLIFLTENLPILNPCLPQRSENLRPHPSNSIEMRPHHNHHSRENATACSGTSPLASCKGIPPLGKRRIENSGAVWGISVQCPHSWRRETGSPGVDCTFVTRYSVKKKVGVKNEAVTTLKVACSRRSDSGERCEVKRSAKK